MGLKAVSGDDSDNSGPEQHADDDIIQTFQLEETLLRGRAVRIGKSLTEILDIHDYPEPVSQLVAETVTLTVLLSSMLKYDGIFTLQTKGDGPVSMLVADVTSAGDVRACATFDQEKLEAMGEDSSFEDYVGKGHVAFTVDQGGKTDRYQGIVELKGASLVDCIQYYFSQSEQIGTGIKMAVKKTRGKWRAGAIMLQHMPEEGKNPQAGLSSAREDDWRRSMILLNSCTDQELLDPGLHSNALLFRLFHEEGVRVYEPKSVQRGCRCDEEKVRVVLTGMTEDDLDYMADKDGKIEVRCEFCSRSFIFKRGDIQSLSEN